MGWGSALQPTREVTEDKSCLCMAVVFQPRTAGFLQGELDIDHYVIGSQYWQLNFTALYPYPFCWLLPAAALQEVEHAKWTLKQHYSLYTNIIMIT